jgi:hypothetical protein
MDRLAPPAAILLLVFLLHFAAPASAQEAASHFDHPVFLVAGEYGMPTRLSGSAGLLIAPPTPFSPGNAPDSRRVGVVVKGTAGTGGFSIAAGGAALAHEGPLLTTGLDALATVTRTGPMPRGAGADSTYVGLEAGLVLMSVRLSAGAAHRTAGTHGPKGTIFTVGVGVQIPLGW